MYFISPARPSTLPLRHHSLPPSLHTGRTTVVSGDAFAFAPARTVSRSRRHMRRRRECNSRRMQGPAAIMLSSDRDYITGPDIPEWTPCGPKLRENEMLEKAGFRAVRVPVSPVRHVPNTQFVLYAEKVLRRAGVHQPDIPVKGIEAVMEVEARPPPPSSAASSEKTCHDDFSGERAVFVLACIHCSDTECENPPAVGSRALRLLTGGGRPLTVHEPARRARRGYGRAWLPHACAEPNLCAVSRFPPVRLGRCERCVSAHACSVPTAVSDERCVALLRLHAVVTRGWPCPCGGLWGFLVRQKL